MATKPAKLSNPPPILPTVSREEGIELLKGQRHMGEELIKKNFLSLEDVQYWNRITKDVLAKVFGNKFDYIDSILHGGEDLANPAFQPDNVLEKNRRKNLQVSLEMLNICIEQTINKDLSKPDKVEMIEIIDTSEPQKPSPKRYPEEEKSEFPPFKESPKVESRKWGESTETAKRKKVFIIHGEDEEKKEAVVRFLRKLDLEPVILHDQGGHGKSLIEKFEQFAEYAFAIFILTGDDFGYPKGQPGESQPRPKQNVIFELGFLIGRLKRNLICALYEEGLELPSDYQGAVFIPFDDGGLWKLLIARAMKMANVEIDLNKAV
jgi:predicted nucleotide-binding protein